MTHSSVTTPQERRADRGALPGALGIGERACFIVLVLAHAPLAAAHLGDLWWRPHYQFFPLLLLVAIWLGWRRWPSTPFVPSLATKYFLGGGVFLLTGAVTLNSPWLGSVALLVTMAGMLLRTTGRGFWRTLFPVWALLWLIVPPPARYDERLIAWLQSQTTQAAGAVLEVMGILHLRSGNVIETPGKQFFVEEACSGINSILAVIAGVAVFACWTRRPLTATAGLLVAAVLWTGWANLVRVAMVVAGDTWWHVDLTVGWIHELLGMATFGLALSLIASTDRCMSLVWHPLADFEDDLLKSFRHTGSVLDDDDDSPEAPAADARRRSAVWCLPVAAWCGFLLFVQAVAFSRSMSSGLTVAGVPTWRPSPPQAMWKPNRETLVPAAAGWRLADYDRIERSSSSILGPFSQTWVFESPFGHTLASFDYPFRNWHHLTYCYQVNGWTVTRRTIVEPSSNAAGIPYVELEVVKPAGEYGYVVFAIFDESAVPLTPADNEPPQWQKLLARLTDSPIVFWKEPTPSPGSQRANVRTCQFQLFTESDHPLSIDQRDHLQQQFLRFCQALRNQWTPSS